MVDVSQVVEGSAFAHSVPVFLTDLQVAPAANDSLVKLAHDLEGVAEVARGLGLTQPVAHRAGQGQVVLVVLHGLDVVAHVKVGVPQLTVDGAQSSKVVRPSLGRKSKKIRGA